MINSNMRSYNFYTFGEVDSYGQPQLSHFPKGTIKMAINLSSQATTDNINYSEASYIGLTHDAKVDDTYVIEFGAKKLKVLYVNTFGRLNQVFMSEL